MKRLFAAAVLAGIATVAYAAQQVRFAAGHASVPLPDAFQVMSTDKDLIATFGKDADHAIVLTLIRDLSGPGVPADKAVQFVETRGEKVGAKVTRSGERAFLMETGKQETNGGTTFQTVHWLIAAQNCVFTVTLTAPLPMSKELDAFLGDPLNAIVQEIACTGP